MEELQGVHYDAFISYRHCELDSFVAEHLHKKLEKFKLPKSVRSKVKNGKTGISRVFRDVDELPLSDNLSDPINNAIANTDFLITICTPRYPESRWCMKEIELFLQTHPRDHILVVLAEDEPYNSFPEILTYEEFTRLDENGNEVKERKEIEPLAADTRGENHKEILKAMDTAVIKLCAAIFGLNYDDLKQRHREQKIRKMATIFGSIGAAVLAFAVFATVMLIKVANQNRVITEQYAEIQDKYAGTMADVSQKLMGTGRKKDAVYTVRGVLPDDPSEGYNANALKELYTAMDVYNIADYYAPVCAYELESEVMSFSVSFDNSYVLLEDYNGVILFDAQSGEIVTSIGDLAYPLGFCGSGGFLYGGDDGAYFYDIDSGETKKEEEFDSYVSVFGSPEGTITLVATDSEILGIDNHGDVAYRIDIHEYFDDGDLFATAAAFDAGNFIIAFEGDGNHYMLIGNGETGAVRFSLENEGNGVGSLALKGDNVYYSVEDYNGPGFTYMSKAYSIDLKSGTTRWENDLVDFSVTSIDIAGEYVYLSNMSSVIVIDDVTGNAAQIYTTTSGIIETWTDEDNMYYLDFDGNITFCNSTLIMDYSGSFYTVTPSSFLQDAVFKNGELFVSFGRAEYVTKYAKEWKEDAEIIGQDTDYEIRYSAEEDAEDRLLENPEVNSKLLDTSFFSEDGLYIFAMFKNNVGRIYDADTLQCLASFDIVETVYSKLWLSENTEFYILDSLYDSYVFDENWNIIFKTSKIVAEEDGFFIVSRADDTLCSIPYYDYEYILELADEYLGDYKPSSATKEKYNIR